MDFSDSLLRRPLACWPARRGGYCEYGFLRRAQPRHELVVAVLREFRDVAVLLEFVLCDLNFPNRKGRRNTCCEIERCCCCQFEVAKFAYNARFLHRRRTRLLDIVTRLCDIVTDVRYIVNNLNSALFAFFEVGVRRFRECCATR
jgi:hypothetical protein